jgi:hypothetical protein
MVNFQDQRLRQIGEMSYRSQFTTRLRDQKKGLPCIGMGFFRRRLRGLTACPQWDSVRLRLDHLSHTSSGPVCTELLGITLTTRLNTLVSDLLNSYSTIALTRSVGGLLGPLIVHGPKNADYDIDLGPVFLTDWYHTEYFKIVEEIMKPLKSGGNPKPASDNNLINGKMNFDCSTVAAGDTTPCTDGAGISKFKFTTGKTHRLRLINAGSEGLQRFSIDGHNMTVIANDFVPIASAQSSSSLPNG